MAITYRLVKGNELTFIEMDGNFSTLESSSLSIRSSFDIQTGSIHAFTGSIHAFTSSYNSGSFTGSFIGNITLNKTITSGNGITPFSFDGTADASISLKNNGNLINRSASLWDSSNSQFVPSIIGDNGSIASIAGGIYVEGNTVLGINSSTTTDINSNNIKLNNLPTFSSKIPTGKILVISGSTNKIVYTDQIDGLYATGSFSGSFSGSFYTSGGNSTDWNTAYTQTRQWDGGSTGLTAATGRTSLGLVIGTDVQAYNDNLTTYANITPSTDVQTLLGSDNNSTIISNLGISSSITEINYVSGAISNIQEQIDNKQALVAKWELRDTPSKNIKGIAHGMGMIVGVGSSGTGDRAIYSRNGVDWDAGVTPADNQWNSTDFFITKEGVKMFIAVASSGTGDRAMYTTDGINWQTGSSAADNQWSKVKSGNGLAVAVSVTGTLNRVMTTEDGINWEIQTTPNNNILQDVEYFEEFDRWLTVASSGTNNRVATSDDRGVTWIARTTPEDNNFKTITSGKGRCIALSTDGVNQLMYSDDGGDIWASGSCPAGTWEESWYDNRGIFFAVSSDESTQSAMYSIDGKNWELLDTPDGLTLIEVIDADGLIVALNFKNGGNSIVTSGVFHPERNVFNKGLTSKSVNFGVGEYNSILTTNGRIGLGTETPSATLDVVRSDAPTSNTSKLFNYHQSSTGSVTAYVMGGWTTGAGGSLLLRINNLSNNNPTWQLNSGTSEAIKFSQNSIDKFEINAAGNGIFSGSISGADGTFTNNLTIESATVPTIIIDGGTSQNKRILFRTTSSTRWALLSDDEAETIGTFQGSNFKIFYYDDTGSYRGTALSIERSTGLIQINQGLRGTSIDSSPIGVDIPASIYGTTGTFSGVVTGSNLTITDWNTAYTQTRQWDGGSTGLTAATGRTSLGLGSIATQSSSSIIIEGGIINGSEIGNITPSAGTFTTINASGNGTFTSNLKVESTGASTMIIDAPSSQNRRISWRSNNSARWALLVNNTTESGGDAGSDLRLFYYNDSGSFSGTALSIERSTGLVQITQGIENTTIGANTPAPATFTKINTGGTVTVAADDLVYIGDTDDSGNLKEVTAQSIADLASVGKATTGNDLTISSGSITPTAQSKPIELWSVDTEAGAASDDLETISTANADYGDIIILETADNARDVVVKDGIGNIQCGSDFTLTRISDKIMLMYNGSSWSCLSKQTN